MLFDEVLVTTNVPKLGNTRTTGKEQFYTPIQVARAVVDRCLAKGSISTGSTFLEPAGGTGSFICAAREAGFTEVVSVDIEPLHPDVMLGDFLKMPLTLSHATCISNPPFGRNNALSVPFFNTAARYCDTIAFIVPRSWRKWSVLNRLDPAFELVDDWDLNIDYVDSEGHHSHGVGNLRTCVQVWRRLTKGIRKRVTVSDFRIVEKSTPLAADVSLTQFGYGCGTIKTDFPRRPNSTQMFLKLIHPRALEALNSVPFDTFYNHTAYTEALGMQEINFLLNRYLGLESFPYSTNPSSEHYLGLEVVEQDPFGDVPRIF